MSFYLNRKDSISKGYRVGLERKENKRYNKFEF